MMIQLYRAFRLYLALTIVTGAFYPLLVTGVTAIAFGREAGGSLIFDGERVVGSNLIGQPFEGLGYFWPRPSATSPAYNGLASGGSNLGVSNPELFRSVERAARRHLAATASIGALAPGSLPIDLVTASASGLDPHLSPAAALWQVPRVARARGLPEAQVRTLVQRMVEGRQLGILGEPRVNVLQLNRALDQLGKSG